MTDHGSLGVDGLDRLLADTGRALQAIRSGAPAGGDGTPAEGTGTAADGQVRAVVRAPGTVTGLDVDPRLLRRPAEEVSAEIIVAVNAALADLRSRAAEATAAAGGADLRALQEQLTAVHGESIRQMSRFTSAINGAVAEIRARKS